MPSALDRPRGLLLLGEHSVAHRDLAGQLFYGDLGVELVVLANRAYEKEYAQARGCTVLGLSRPILQDADKLVEYLRAQSDSLQFSFAFTPDEAFMEVLGEVRAKLDIPGLKPDQVRLFRDKVAMKEALTRSGIRVPEFSAVADEASARRILGRHGKAVVKQRRGWGSIGFTPIESEVDFERWKAKATRPDAFEIEEYISGTMYSLNVLMIGAQVRLLGVILNRPGMADVDFSRGLPFVLCSIPPAPSTQRFEDYAYRVAESLNLRDGVMHIEIFVRSSGEIVFCEVAARPGGSAVMRVLENQYGVHFGRAALLIEAGRGETALEGLSSRPKIAGFIGFRAGRQGFIREMVSEADLDFDWVEHVSYTVRPGRFLARACHAGDFFVLIDLVGDDLEDFNEKANRLHRVFDELLVLADTAS
jgi:phosphoribosylaminoimidazole carboxylase (NCAIR synthetase)